LGITVNNLAVRLHRARKQMRARLEKFCRDCSTAACVDCTCD
jgi:RNA polymerase sigma-70 factor (ECF subfamily)